VLQSLFLRDYVIVDSAEIEFANGFCALSGETGAGKSILLDALGLALGNRADVQSVRSGARRTEITASFVPGERVSQWLDEHELANEDDTELLLRRTIDREGRSRAFINGTPVKLAQLRELGSQVLEIHGQHASQSLLRADGQRQLLDSTASLQDQKAQVSIAWREWQTARRTLDQATGYRERERLSWQLEEIQTLALSPGEWESLSDEQSRLANASTLLEAAQSSVQALSDGDQAIDEQLATLVGQLHSGARIDKRLESALDLLESARIQVAEASSDLHSYLDGTELDPARLEIVEQRVSAIFRLARKFTIDPADLAEHGASLAQRLEQLERAQDLDKLREQVEQLQQTYDSQADKLTKLRVRAGKSLAGGVNEKLADLGMPAARFDVAINPAQPGPHGSDQVEFEFAGHASIELRALSKVASGGELSRVSLAIAVCAAQANPVQSLIFDEADAGVGGSVADAIGRLMRTLGESRQVLAVTHLPQVAACAHHHYQVSKQTGNKDKVSSTVTLLDPSQRIDEIARMLGGARITQTTRDHAGELLGLAAPKSKASAKKASTKAKVNRPVKAATTAAKKAAKPKSIKPATKTRKKAKSAKA
jgi:DNA repair protein RecN (Recombination protein N)